MEKTNSPVLSRYNLLFLSKRNGWLFYNSASNAFLSLTEDLAALIKRIMENPDTMDFSEYPDLYFKLRGAGFLVEAGQDDNVYRILKMRRSSFYYSGNNMSLTIALTRDCNFACGYCYEPNRTSSEITNDTEAKIIDFIKRRTSVKMLEVVWYGGEPLLYFDRIKSLTQNIKAIGKEYTAGIITNGFMLSQEVIGQLNELSIKFMQITLDGPKEVHDKRRFLKNGGRTFDRIVENIDHLAASDWQGNLQIRVNIDPENQDDYVKIYGFIKDRYPDKFDKAFHVYPGFVHAETNAEEAEEVKVNPDTNCCFNSADKGRFLAKLAQQHNINALPIFPHMTMGGCTMTRRNAYVIGPEGELYKCWNDLGIEKKVVGRIDGKTGWNMGLVAEGLVDASYLEDPTCQKCFFFPICDGGCANIRMKNQRDQGNRDTCSYFKESIRELLEIHYEQKQRNV